MKMAQSQKNKIYADHLNTPKRVADNTNNIIWEWESKPFGEDKPTGSYTLNLRFPGQYFDSETNTHYNINRDYNPTTGRYIQSDPIGFEGGSNTFLYANGNSVRFVDESGLIVGSVLKAAKECIKNPKKCKKSICNTLNAGMHSVCDTVRSCKGTDGYVDLKLKKTQLQICLIMRKAVSICHGKKNDPNPSGHARQCQQVNNRINKCNKFLDKESIFSW